MSLFNQLRHETVKECKQQGTDMGAVHIGIGHDDDFVVTKLADIKVFMDTRTERGNHSLDFRIGINLVQSCFFHIQNFSSKGKNCLGCTGSCRLGAAARGISFDDVNFAIFRILIGAVSQFSGQRHAFQSRFSSGKLSCLSCRFPCSLRQNGFFADGLGNVGVLLQVVSKLLGNNIVHSSSCFGVAELLLGLTFKLRLLNLDADNCRQTFSDILAGKVCFAVF